MLRVASDRGSVGLEVGQRVEGAALRGSRGDADRRPGRRGPRRPRRVTRSPRRPGRTGAATARRRRADRRRRHRRARPERPSTATGTDVWCASGPGTRTERVSRRCPDGRVRSVGRARGAAAEDDEVHAREGVDGRFGHDATTSLVGRAAVGAPSGRGKRRGRRGLARSGPYAGGVTPYRAPIARRRASTSAKSGSCSWIRSNRARARAVFPLRSSRSASAYQRRRCSGRGRLHRVGLAGEQRDAVLEPAAVGERPGRDDPPLRHELGIGRRRGELLPELVDPSPALLGPHRVHQHRVLLHRVGQLDEGLELGRRGAVVAEPVLREAGQLADAGRVGKRVAHGSEDPDRLLVAVVRVRIGGFHEPVEEVLPAPTAEAQDLGLDVARRTSTATLRAVRGVALPVMLAAPGHPRSVGGLSNGSGPQRSRARQRARRFAVKAQLTGASR